MRILMTTLALLAPAAVFSQEANKAILTLVDEGDFNKVEVALEVILGNSSDTSTLSGTVEVCLNIDPATNTTDQLVIAGADLSGSDITLSKSGFLGNYTASSSGLKLTASTLEGMGSVNGIEPDSDPPYQTFPADEHQFVVNEGTLSGEARALATDPVAISQDYAVDPFEGTGTGTGQIFITPTIISDGKQFYEVVVILPISLQQELTVEGSPLTADASLDGALKAVGTTFLNLPPQSYSEWALGQNLGDTSGTDFSLSSNVPNYHFYALGFEAANAPEQILTFSPAGMILNTGGGSARGSLEIQWSTDLENWERVPDAEMTSGSSLIVPSTDLETGIVAGFGSESVIRYYRVVGDPAS